MRTPDARHSGPWTPSLRVPAVLAALVLLSTPVLSRAANPGDWAGSRPIVPAELALPDVESARMGPAALEAPGGGTLATDPLHGRWYRIAPPLGVGTFNATMIHDPPGGRMIVFGGLDDEHHYSNEVSAFEISTGTWSTLSPTGERPAGRSYHAAVFDPVQRRMIVFGGWASGILDDVWQLSLSGTPAWTRLDPGPGPSPRAGCGAIYDAANQRMIVLGGLDLDPYTGKLSGEVWALSLSGTPSWSRLEPEGETPAPRFAPSVAYDPAGPSLLLVGADDGSAGELWRLSLGGVPAWSRVAISGGPGTLRNEPAAGFDPASRRLLAFGGYTDWGMESELWILNLSGASPAWTLATPKPSIPARWGAASAMASDGRFFVYGGMGRYRKPLADVWAIPAASPAAWQTWQVLLPPRLQEVMVHDTARDRLVVFGGTDGAYRNDSYVHSMVSGRGWEPLATAGVPPPARRLHTGVNDPEGDRLIVFGGYDDHLLGDLWQLTFSGTPTWSPLAASGAGPSPRGGHVAIYDPVGRRMIVYGGYDGVSAPAYRIGDVWALSLAGTPAWSPIATTGPRPSARSSATAVYDATRHAMIVFGGTDPNFRDDAWSLSLGSTPSWSLVGAGTPKPGAREEQSAVFDTKRDRMVIFGGYDAAIRNYGDLWALGPGSAPAWTPQSPEGTAPSARWGMKAVADPGRDGMWLYGGWGSTYLRDLWFLQWVDPPTTAPVALAGAGVSDEAVHLDWVVPGDARVPLQVERSTDGSAWTRLGLALPEANGHVRFRESGVPNGVPHAWRVRADVAGVSLVSEPAWVTIGGTVGVENRSPSLALRPAGRASGPGAVALVCALPGGERARVDLFDLAGRVLDSRDLSGSGGGIQRVELGRGLPSGLYFARLRSGNAAVSLRVIHTR